MLQNRRISQAKNWLAAKEWLRGRPELRLAGAGIFALVVLPGVSGRKSRVDQFGLVPSNPAGTAV